MSNENAESQQEPSMEEILASIRRIISEDDEPGADASDGDTAPMEDASADADPPPPPPPPPEPDPEPAPQMDAVEEKPEPPPPPPPPPVAAPVPQDDVLELTNVVDEPPKPPAGDQYIDLNRPPMRTHNIVSDQPAVSTSEYFARLAIIAQERGQLGGSITVEEMSRELMRPMLQAWLDENLPRIVERQVQNEIERIVRKSHDL